ncbi:PIR protein CIR protein [Plasmodium vinckei]|uniref:PIR protein CIR protein n=1 Tax=Plasmodium vinckei TaxID=5860 RepID=A0A6V7TIC6_PLAVN|nr:PIR protein CIR protein [Plasmodium vinckei]
MVERACKFLRDIDKYFTNEIVDVTKFNNFTKCHSYCPYENRKLRPCENNYERISALGGYLYNKLFSISNNLKGEGDNGNRHIEIFMMWLGDKLYKLEKNKAATLEQSYKDNLEKHTGNYKYWNLLGSKQEYKIANAWYMSELYSLLNHICSIVIEYKKDKNKKKIEQISSQCSQEFKNVYNNIKNCYSYFHLLKYLKSIYDDIRNDANKEAADKKVAIKQTITRNNDFKRAISQQKKDSRQILEYILNASTISLIDLTPQDWNQRFSEDSIKILDLHTKNCSALHSEIVQQVKKDISKNAPTAQFQPEPQSASQKSEASPQSGTNDSGTQKENSNSEGGGPGSETGDTSGGQSDQGGSSGGSDSQGGSSNQGGSDDGSKASGDQVQTHPSGASSGYLPSIWGTSFNLMSYMPNVSGIYQSSKDILTSATNKISDAYTNTVGIVKGAYDKTVTTVKNAYTTSTNYIGGAVTSITDQLSSFGTFQLSDDKSGSNSLGGGVDTSDQSQQNLKQPENPPPPPSLPPSPSPLQTSPDPSSPKPIDPQPIPTHISKGSDQQIAPTDGNIGSQTPPPGQGTLASSGSNSLNTKNGNVISVANVKLKEISSIWCIGSNNKCDITGISIIIISISIVLTIMYKYLSLGCTSKSKRKKSVKKVINSIGGKRPIQIIIKSYDRNKDLKPVINSVGRKKDPLLNIYKLMQADPVPFINVFFLLIFFVYKRKYDFLEL